MKGVTLHEETDDRIRAAAATLATVGQLKIRLIRSRWMEST
jgi:hypothetical protein